VTDSTTPTAQSAQSVLTLLVQPRAPWINSQTMQGISNLLVDNGACTGCHNAGATPAGDLSLTGSADDIWDRLQLNSRVAPSDPLSSRLLQCPGNATGNTCGHPPILAFRDDPADDTDIFSRILRWIREGAFENDAADATCAVATQCPQP
jgi:hypothetical protein